ncbi:hypothetical protein Ddc_19461 [Ditylenchus destructor]|nr:hypothetical protein Ddc_19461 [Ditylenchus destructor]
MEMVLNHWDSVPLYVFGYGESNAELRFEQPKAASLTDKARHHHKTRHNKKQTQPQVPKAPATLAQQAVQSLNSNETGFRRELTVVLGARSEQVDQSTAEYHLHLVNNVTLLQTTTVSLNVLLSNAQPLDEIQESVLLTNQKARRLDQAKGTSQQQYKEFSQMHAQQQQIAQDKTKQLSKVEAEARKMAAELEKKQEKDIKQENKDRQKLEEQGEKTMKIAQKLAEKQAVARKEEERTALEELTRKLRLATVDVLEHRRYETTEPMVKAEVATDKGDEKESHGLVDKIKSLF